jgi:DNA-directed RNA polymerase subunit RPC12/RpoP
MKLMAKRCPNCGKRDSVTRLNTETLRTGDSSDIRSVTADAPRLPLSVVLKRDHYVCNNCNFEFAEDRWEV